MVFQGHASPIVGHGEREEASLGPNIYDALALTKRESDLLFCMVSRKVAGRVPAARDAISRVILELSQIDHATSEAVLTYVQPRKHTVEKMSRRMRPNRQILDGTTWNYASN